MTLFPDTIISTYVLKSISEDREIPITVICDPRGGNPAMGNVEKDSIENNNFLLDFSQENIHVASDIYINLQNTKVKVSNTNIHDHLVPFFHCTARSRMLSFSCFAYA